MRLVLLALVLCAGCALYHDETMRVVLIGQSAVTVCTTDGVTKRTTVAGAAGQPEGDVGGTATQRLTTNVTGPCKTVEGGPMSPMLMATFGAAFAAVVAIAAMVAF